MFQFKSLRELLAFFADEKTCWDYLEKQLWDGKPVCPHCGSTVVYRLANHKQFKCGNKKTCDKKFTVLVGTIYENTKLPLSVWFGAIYLSTQHKKGISSHQLARDFGITQRSAWFVLHRINKMIEVAATNAEFGETVAIDETYVKGEAKNRTKYQRKRIADGERIDAPGIVLGIVEPKGNAILTVVKSAETHELEPAINKTVRNAETIIVTDGHVSYPAIGLNYKGHIIINHAMGEYVNAGYSTNAAEGAFSWFKRTIFGTHHFVSAKHLNRYCLIFSYRYNTRRFSEPMRFDTTMKQGKGRLKYADLVAGKS